MKRIGLALVSVTMARAAIAAQAAPDPFAEVTVTARRVAEAAASVPLAIDVVQADHIALGAVVDLDSLAMQLPGLSFESLWGGSFAAPILRGQSQPSAAGDNVGLFVDDIYQAGRAAIDIPMLDLERIEVVRGPQNTQFGRSTFAGAIRYVPRQPTAEFSGQLRVEVGSDALAGVQALVSRRLFESRWLGRLAVTRRQDGGTRESIAGETLGDSLQQAAAMTLALESAEGGYRPVVLSARIQQSLSGHPASSTVDAGSFNCGAKASLSAPWSYYCGEVPVARQFSLTPRIPDSDVRSWQVALHLEQPLGTMTLRSLTGFYDASYRVYRDFDGSADGLLSGVCTIGVNCPADTPFANVTRFLSPNVVSRPQGSTTDWSQELRLGREDTDGLRWMIGLSASLTRSEDSGAFGVDRGDLQATERLTNLVATNANRTGSLSLLNSALVGDSRYEQVSQSETLNRSETVAAFGSLDVPVADRSRARLELRGEREELRVESRRANFRPNTAPDPPPQSFSVLLPRVSVDFRPTEAWYGYASLARGARSGGINTLPELNEAERGFEPEYNWTSELGVRYRGTGLIAGWQTTLYRIDWDNTQITGVSTTPGVSNLITSNTAGLTTHGLESQLLLQFGQNWAASTSFSWTDPRFNKGSDDPGSRAFCGLTVMPPSSTFCAFGPSRADANGNLLLVPYLDDNRAARAPRTMFHIGLQARPRTIVGEWMLGAEATLGYQDEVYERPINGAMYGARTLLGARGTLQGGNWNIELWGTNLTNDRHIRAASSRGGAFYPSLPRPIDLLHNEGRRVGLTVSLDLR